MIAVCVAQQYEMNGAQPRVVAAGYGVAHVVEQLDTGGVFE